MAPSPPSNCGIAYGPISGQIWHHLLSSEPTSSIRSAAIVPIMLCQPDLLLPFLHDAKQHHVVCLQAFAALRILTEQMHMQNCTSITVTQGIQVEITSAFLRVRLACQQLPGQHTACTPLMHLQHSRLYHICRHRTRSIFSHTGRALPTTGGAAEMRSAGIRLHHERCLLLLTHPP